MKPDWEWSLADYRRGMDKVVAVARSTACGCGGQRGWGREVDAFNKPLRRYRIPAEHSCRWCLRLGKGMLEDGLHLLVRAATRAEAEYLVTLYEEVKAGRVPV